MLEQCRQYQENFGTETMPDEWANHAQQCSECQAFVQRQEALRQSLSAWQTPPVADDFALVVMSRLAETQTRKIGVWDRLQPWLSHRLSIPVPAGALAMALLIISLMFNAYQWLNYQVAGSQSSPVIVNIPNGLPTPLTNTVQSPSLTSFGNQWSGTGAFLLIPLMNLHNSEPANSRIYQSDNKTQDI